MEQAGSPMLVHGPPLTTLAYMAVGKTREVGGRGEEKRLTAGTQQARLACLWPQRRGKRGGRGRGRLTAILLDCCAPLWVGGDR